MNKKVKGRLLVLALASFSVACGGSIVIFFNHDSMYRFLIWGGVSSFLFILSIFTLREYGFLKIKEIDNADVRVELELAALREDIKTLVIENEIDTAYELFVLRTREMIGSKAELPSDFQYRTAEQIKLDLYNQNSEVKL